MKDEEMAEEIANKRCHEIMCYGHCSFNSPKHHRCGEWHREYNCALAGLKAGRPQWHDLRKDPNDLPPKMVSNHNFSIEVLSDRGEIVCYNFHYCEWFYWRSGEPIAWCEIPNFDKE